MITSMRVDRLLIVLGCGIGIFSSAVIQKYVNSQTIKNCAPHKSVLVWESSPVGDRIICTRKVQIPMVNRFITIKD
jgi:hypothetical protein